MKAWLIVLVVVLIVVVAVGIVWLSRGETAPARPPVIVGRSTVERIAVASGSWSWVTALRWTTRWSTCGRS